MKFVPFVAWLKANDHLVGRKVVTYSGMRPYYFFLAEEEYTENKLKRHWLPVKQSQWPARTAMERSPWHIYPDYRTHFSVSGLDFDRPVLFIQNKFTVEWGVGPINYLPLTFLDWLLQQAAERFHVIYSRPGITHDPVSYSRDENSYCDYPDRQVLKKYPGVEVLEEKCLQSNLDYNLYKLQLLAKCYHFISVQGGGAQFLPYCSNSILLVYHQKGQEYPHAYLSGSYKYLSTPPPLLMVARNHRNLERGAKVLLSTQADEQGVTVEKSFLPVLEELRF
jgi:hypothetical protein